MAGRYKAKKAAARKARQVFRSNIRKPKKVILKKFANFVGKSTFKVVKKRRFGGRRNRRRNRRY